MTDLASCSSCGNLLGRSATDRQRDAIEVATRGHRVMCGAARNLIAAVRYVSADGNDDPDPAANLAGAVTAYLEGHHPALFEELSIHMRSPEEEK